MPKFAVFLRGVNVGGVKVLMKDLVALLEGAGYTQVDTLLASGNVVLEAGSASAAQVRQRCDALLEEHYGRSIPTLVFTRSELLALAEPFPLALPEPAAEHHGYLTLCASAGDAKALLQVARAADEAAPLQQSGRALCWVARKGQSTTSALSKVMAAQARQRVITTRNHNTMVKLAAIIG